MARGQERRALPPQEAAGGAGAAAGAAGFGRSDWCSGSGRELQQEQQRARAAGAAAAAAGGVVHAPEQPAARAAGQEPAAGLRSGRRSGGRCAEPLLRLLPSRLFLQWRRLRRRLRLPPVLGWCLRTFSATSTGMELECVFFSVTPKPGKRSMIARALTSSSRASSLIRT